MIDLTQQDPTDRPDFVETQADPASETIASQLAQVGKDVKAFDKIAAGLERLRAQHPVNLVLDVTTPKGMQQAIAGRAAWRNPRTELERTRKAAKAPILALGRSIDQFAADLETQLRIGESNYHDQIKVEEERKARAKAEAEEKERDRVAAIQARIAFNFSSLPMRFASKPAAAIMAAMHAVSLAEISEATYAERSQDAIEAKARALSDLQVLHKAAEEREAESERLRVAAEEHMRKAAELAQQQADFEESKRAERQRIVDEANAREAQQRVEREAQETRLRMIAEAEERIRRAERAEEDRKAAAERQRLDEEAAERRHIAQRMQEEEDALVSSIQANAQRIEADTVPYIEKAIGAFESGAKDFADDTRPRIVNALARAREYMAARLENAKASADRAKKEAAAARALKKAQKQAALAPRLLAALADLLAQLDQADSPDGGDIKQYEAAKSRARALIAEAEAE